MSKGTDLIAGELPNLWLAKLVNSALGSFFRRQFRAGRHPHRSNQTVCDRTPGAFRSLPQRPPDWPARTGARG
jgi:hypothetical protein